MAPRSRNSSSSRGRGLTDDEPFRVLYKMGRTLVSALLLGFFFGFLSLFFKEVVGGDRANDVGL